MRRVLDFFSSIWTGVVLLTLLFIYCSVGSAGLWLPGTGFVQIRQYPIFEMTEFEWFHWWPFDLLVGLVCLTIVTATIRRIPFKPVNYGVWMIHSGILLLAAGSVLYFGTKLEGDVPVARRQVVAQLPGHEPVAIVAVPGRSMQVGPPEDPYTLSIASIDPQWEILSGEDQGKRAYSVNVHVRRGPQEFIRQVLAGYPEYTEDLVRSDDPTGPPWARAKKTLGTATVDDTLEVSLDYDPQRYFYLSNDINKSWAVYLRELPDDGPPPPWVERPVDGMPLYNDRLDDLDAVWPGTGGRFMRPDPLDVTVAAASPDDPLPDTEIAITSYLRYAFMEPRRRQGGEIFDPAVALRVQRADGQGQDYELVALDPMRQMEPGGRMLFEWADTQQALDDISTRHATLRVRVPSTTVDFETPIAAPHPDDEGRPFEPIEGTSYSYRVTAIYNNLQLPGGSIASVAAVEIRTPQKTWIRWVSDDPSFTRDLPLNAGAEAMHAEVMPLDEGLVMEFRPGLPPVTIVGGPGESDLRLVLSVGGATPEVRDLVPRSPMPLTANLTLIVHNYSPYTQVQERPVIVPLEQRNRDARARLSMVRIAVPGADGPQRQWLHFNHWPFEQQSEVFGPLPYRTAEVTLDDGRRIELMFSRQRRLLPGRVVLDDFLMEEHTGGFTGSNLSILNWTSEIRFETADGWTEPMAVSVNDPRAYGGLSYFQAQWDPPEPEQGYAGLNYTVLGVGNRHGVNIQLLGCCLSVLGMIYAFYVKPVIKRRQQQAVYRSVAVADTTGADEAELEPVGAMEEST